LHNWCEILKLDVKAHMSCGLYVPGEPSQDATPPVRGEDTSAAAVAKRRAEEARAKVADQARIRELSEVLAAPPRLNKSTASKANGGATPKTNNGASISGTCSDCRFFDGDETCRLFVALNKASRGIFDLNVVTHRRWRCEAQSPVKVQPPVALTNVVFGHGHPEVSALDAMSADQNAFADLVAGEILKIEPLYADVIETEEPSAVLPLDDEADFEKFVAEEAR
jgi:hypothetical protein